MIDILVWIYCLYIYCCIYSIYCINFVCEMFICMYLSFVLVNDNLVYILVIKVFLFIMNIYM